MEILVLNCGSSSLKYQVFSFANEKILAKGIVDRIGMSGSVLKYTRLMTGIENKHVILTDDIKNHKEAVSLLVGILRDQEYGVLRNVSDIRAIGHRIVHGGEKFSDSIIIDDISLDVLEKCSWLAPLHNPPSISGIKAAQKHFSNAIQVAVFDTSFYQSIPQKAFLYGLPYKLYEKYRIRRYGFHGTSHKYVVGRAAQLMELPLEKLKIITLHLGNGTSITAVKYGTPVDTSMGFTPLEGLIMGTRSGSFDPAIVPFIMAKEDLNVDEVNTLLNKKSGLLGLSGLSSDFRDLQEAESQGNEKAKAALEIYVYNIVKYIGSYYMVMGGADALIFTAGVGENSSLARERICSYLGFLGIELDKEKNKITGCEAEISVPFSPCKIFVIPTNEELMIAREAKRLSNQIISPTMAKTRL